MDITKTVVSLREAALLYGDYGTYHTQLSRKLLNCRKKLNIATKNRGKFQNKGTASAEQIGENHEYLRLQLLTAERTWANAMSMKATHTADTKGINSKARSHIVSRLEKGAKTAQSLADALSQTAASGASPTDVLEARAYAALLKGAAHFEKQNWQGCLKSYAVARIIYTALAASVKEDIFKDLLSETIDPSIRYAAYQAKIPRTEPVPSIARKAFLHAGGELVSEVKEHFPSVLEHGGLDDKKGSAGGDGAPSTLTWRGREVKIEDAAIAVAWASVAAAKEALSEKVSSSSQLLPKDVAAAYDDILIASQDAVDATKQAIDELKGEGVPQSDPRMQGLQITRTAVNFEMISWRIGRNRVLIGKDDGAHLDFGEAAKTKKAEDDSSPDHGQDLAPGRQIAKLKEKVVLYDGILQSIESVSELPGVANDEELSSRLEATEEYFTALKCLAIARSHSIAGNALNALALIKHALDESSSALPILSAGPDAESGYSPRNIHVNKNDAKSLHDLLSGELQRSRALVEILNSNKKSTSVASQSGDASKPLAAQLSNYPSSGIDLENIVAYPPQLEHVPVKPLFLDVAWNYIDYPDKKGPSKDAESALGKANAAAAEPEAKPQKRGWFGFGR
ncbi:signal recognition particle subunit SRP68 [Podospora aff. communis PSN243]|uniref:Signal recognition particle subunit SRP68 n=1 Tax=Podospora aff. communis PSN243 TaxID=3040156 RepID=A0AAV9H228_9PEZI|nr:signal recognition particle subunit SRP68 [Podospora aff. communis PSN243]